MNPDDRQTYRGDSFDILFPKVFSNKEILQLFNERKFTLKDIDKTTYRIINYWTEIGLIDDNRQEDNQWKRFSMIDILWIQIIKELRKFGFPNDKIKKVKENIFTKMETDEGLVDYPLFEYYIILAKVHKNPIYLLVFADGFSDFASEAEFLNQRYVFKLTEHLIFINLVKILNETFKTLNIIPEYDFFPYLTEEENKIIGKFGNSNISKVEILLKNGKITHIRNTTQKDIKEKIANIIKEKKYQRITIETENGKPVYIESVEKQKPS